MTPTKRTPRPRPDIARWQLYLCCLLLVACTIPWRRATYFSGALDPVVAAKGLIGSIGLAMAFLMSRRVTRHTPLGARTLTFAGLYLAVSCLGGWAAGQALPSVVVAVRVAMLLGSLVMLLQAVGVSRLITAMVRTMGLVALFAVGTGAGTLGSGRLQGAVPPLAPNEIAFLTGTVLLLTIQRMMEGQARRSETALAVALFGVVWLTGSRTTAATLFLAVAVMVLQARKFSAPGFLVLVAAVPVVAFAALGTSAVTNMLLRGGDQNVTTLSSRTIAWQAALTMNGSTWQRWFGGGLPMKHIPVSGQYWQTQLLDSSWISALVQTGLVGLTLTAVWVVAALASAFRTPRPWRPLWVGLVVFIGLRSLLESGLFDASTSFIVFAMVSLMSERATRTAPDPGAPAALEAADGDHLVVSDATLRELQLQGQRDARSSRTALTARR
ncbi:O-antigen ligase family protein [Pedococcus sp. P5_B7]